MKLLDLFCGAGGAAMGYHRAGFDEIVGVDIEPQPDYPFDFVQADAMQYMPRGFDLIHASPPCQAFTTMGNRWGNPRWPDLLTRTRRQLVENGTPYVIENVPGAVRHMVNPIRLTGEHFGLSVHRARLFELGGWWTLAPSPRPPHVDPVAVYGRPDGRRLWTRRDGSEHRAWASIEAGQAALETPWITGGVQLAEAIPPAYTEWIGSRFIETSDVQAAARLELE